MAGLGWGRKDDTTKEERAAWKANAERQMNQGSADSADDADDDGNTRTHRRARRPQ